MATKGLLAGTPPQHHGIWSAHLDAAHLELAKALLWETPPNSLLSLTNSEAHEHKDQ